MSYRYRAKIQDIRSSSEEEIEEQLRAWKEFCKNGSVGQCGEPSTL